MGRQAGRQGTVVGLGWLGGEGRGVQCWPLVSSLAPSGGTFRGGRGTAGSPVS